MSDTTAELLAQIQGGSWRAQPEHIGPAVLATADDPVAQALASAPAVVPTTPVPDAVLAGETQGEPTPGSGSEAISAPEPVAGTEPTPPAQPAPEAAQQTATVVITVPPAELKAGDVVQFSGGPQALVRQQGDLWVCSDCTVRFFSHLASIPVIRP